MQARSFERTRSDARRCSNTAERLASHPNKESDVDTLTAPNRLEKTIEAQRQLQLQAHGVLTCLYEVLLHAECEEAVSYAQATYVALRLPVRLGHQQGDGQLAQTRRGL
jgi:hypothetical protein